MERGRRVSDLPRQHFLLNVHCCCAYCRVHNYFVNNKCGSKIDCLLPSYSWPFEKSTVVCSLTLTLITLAPVALTTALGTLLAMDNVVIINNHQTQRRTTAHQRKQHNTQQRTTAPGASNSTHHTNSTTQAHQHSEAQHRTERRGQGTHSTAPKDTHSTEQSSEQQHTPPCNNKTHTARGDTAKQSAAKHRAPG